MSTDESHPTTRLARDDAVLREAAKRLVDTIRPFRVLTRHQLELRSRAESWRSTDFDQVLEWAVQHGELRDLGSDLYELPRPGRPSIER